MNCGAIDLAARLRWIVKGLSLAVCATVLNDSAFATTLSCSSRDSKGTPSAETIQLDLANRELQLFDDEFPHDPTKFKVTAVSEGLIEFKADETDDGFLNRATGRFERNFSWRDRRTGSIQHGQTIGTCRVARARF